MFQLEYIKNLDISLCSKELRSEIAGVLNMISRKEHNSLCTVAFKQTIVGIGLSWGKEFHPHGERISIFTDTHIPEQEELTGALFEGIKSQLNARDYDHAMWSFDENLHIFKKIALNNGFELVRQTFMPTLEIDTVLKDLKGIQPAENLLTLKEITQDPILKRDFFQLLKDNYTATHLISPVAEEPLEVWESLLLDDNPDLQHSYIQFTDQITGYIMLHPVNNEEVELGWVGTTKGQQLELLKPILKKQLLDLKQHGFTKITPEVDTTDPFSTELFSRTNLKTEPAFNTYQLKLSLKVTTT
ncbi:hypothetical protein [Jeotgalibacillus malaysiensis]|uniref:hypothetical protein n=1 Tax=Jeotgalibacillus malaysiensis TaxID=1508404 RepID=UPI00384C88BA